MYNSTRLLCSLFIFLLFSSINVPLYAQPDTLFYETFEDMNNWIPAGPEGLQSWSIVNSNLAGGNAAPEVQFSWVYPFVGESYLLASPIFNDVQGNNMELKFNYYEDYWSNIFYVGVAITGDGGSTYTSIWELQANGNSGPEQITVDFTGINNMQIALYYFGDSNDIDFWYVDDVTLIDLDAVPVELTSFTAQSLKGTIVLNWTTSTEINNKGFEIERSKQSNNSWEKIGFIPGHGTTAKSNSYRFIDNNLNSGVYTYRLKQIDFSGSYEYSKSVDAELSSPAEFALMQNFPNPFNPSTQINFSVPVDAAVKITIYNLLGKKVSQLIDGEYIAGNYNVTFDASSGSSEISSGIYFYVLEAKGSDGISFTSVKKMILMK